jgi:hypothetical protein
MKTFRFCWKKYAMKNIHADLKVTAMLTVLKGRYTKFCFSQCEWDSQVRDCHYRIK